MNSRIMTNFNTPSLLKPRTRILSRQPGPRSLPLNQHPAWPTFLDHFINMFRNFPPEFRPHFLGLLEQADLL